jgi:hypothetical protein
MLESQLSVTQALETGARGRDDIPLLLEIKKLFTTAWFEWNLPPLQLTDWLLVEVALLLFFGLTKIS